MDRKANARALALEGHFTCHFRQQTFDRDFNVFMTVRKMVDRYVTTGQVNERLLINNIVLCLNAFGVKKTNEVFRALMTGSQFSVVRAVLMFLQHNVASISPEISPERVMVDILRHVSTRYNLSHL